MDRKPHRERDEPGELVLHPAAYPCLVPIVAYTPEGTLVGRLTLDALSRDEIELAAGLDGLTTYGELFERTPAYRNLESFADYLVWWDLPLVPEGSDAVESGGCLVISPHPDDAEFSMGGWLLQQRGRRKCVNAICFSQSAYTQFPDVFPSPCEVTAVRKCEAQMAAAMLGIHRIDLDFPDFALRMREPDQELAAHEQELEELLRIELYRLIAEIRPAEIFAPAAIGNHPDHRLVFNILLEFFDTERFPGTAICFYEDVPYSASYYEIDNFLARFETSYLTVRPDTEDISPVVALKNALCGVYRSQVSPQLLDTIEKIAKRTAEFLDSKPGSSARVRAAERFWALEESPLLAD